MQGYPTNLDNSTRANCVCSRCGWGSLDSFFFRLPFHSSFSLSPGWSAGCVGFYDPLRQYFSLCKAVSQREGER